MLTVSQIAEQLNVSNKTVKRWIKDGKLSAYQFGKDYRIEEKDLLSFMEESRIEKTE